MKLQDPKEKQCNANAVKRLVILNPTTRCFQSALNVGAIMTIKIARN